jgi:restriction system protein
MFKAVRSQFPRQGAKTCDEEPVITAEDGEDETADDGAKDYKTRLIDVLRSLPPSGFERICLRLLRESGFQQVVVTGKSGDGGIDGHGVLEINPLVTFKVFGRQGPDRHHWGLHPERSHAGRCPTNRTCRRR